MALTHIHNYDTDLRLFSNGYIELSLLKNLETEIYHRCRYPRIQRRILPSGNHS
ncbi:MAG: hypothetical protein ACLR6J_06235 [Parabacteroides merdae]